MNVPLSLKQTEVLRFIMEFHQSRGYAPTQRVGRRGRGSELNAAYFRDSLRYLRAAEVEAKAPTLFDALFGETEASEVAA